MKMGELLSKDYESWRFGHIPNLEKACKINFYIVINQLLFCHL